MQSMILKSTFDSSSTTSSSAAFKTMTECLGYTLKSEGIKGLYRVLKTKYILTLLYSDLQYTTVYNMINNVDIIL